MRSFLDIAFTFSVVIAGSVLKYNSAKSVVYMKTLLFRATRNDGILVSMHDAKDDRYLTCSDFESACPDYTA